MGEKLEMPVLDTPVFEGRQRSLRNGKPPKIVTDDSKPKPKRQALIRIVNDFEATPKVRIPVLETPVRPVVDLHKRFEKWIVNPQTGLQNVPVYENEMPEDDWETPITPGINATLDGGANKDKPKKK